ncbi:MAG TPA: STAS domain-containing protein [Candidatus Sulfotelmatobacter sp.]|jgi:anti-anti-sigma factor
MNSVEQNSSTQIVSGHRELIKGHEQGLVWELRPLVRRQSVWLDLGRTERIDAAGLAALVSLYCEARETGHEFAVVNPSRRVARVLAIVGLDRMIVSATPDLKLPERATLNLELVA